jgi:hypothetical protein
MLGSSILEVAIGVVFIYLFLGLVSTAVNEGIASLINKRGHNLLDGVKNLLNDPQFTGLAQQLYTHGLVNGMSKELADLSKARRLPSYMSSGTFSLALLDILGTRGIKESWVDLLAQRKKALEAAEVASQSNPADAALKGLLNDAQVAFDGAAAVQETANKTDVAHAEAALAAGAVTGPYSTAQLRNASEKLQTALALGRTLAAAYPDPLTNIQRAVEKLPLGHTRESLLVILAKTRREAELISEKVSVAHRQVEILGENIEEWFNDAMDRVGGWYKRWTQLVLLAISAILVIGLNADTIMLAKRFTRDNALRASVVSATEKTLQGGPAANDEARQQLFRTAESLSLPLGWSADAADPYRVYQIPEDVAGWLMKLLGLVVSIFAVSLGAPFWFDTLSKFINLRGAGTPPGETKKSAPQPTGG